MIGKIIRIIAWILFPPAGWYLTHKHKQRERHAIEEQRHAELVAAAR